MKTPLAQRLRAARAAIHPEVTQRQIAKEMEVSPSAVNLWEAGKTEPSATDLAKLSARYKVSTDWLLGVDVSSGLNRPHAVAKNAVYSVPMVPAEALVRWTWDDATDRLQTIVSYPQQTAAAMVVSNDALATICPAGSFVVVSKGHAAAPGDIVLAAIGASNDPVLRRYVKEGNVELLVADDSRYPSYRTEDGAKIIGRVTEVTIRKSLL